MSRSRWRPAPPPMVPPPPWGPVIFPSPPPTVHCVESAHSLIFRRKWGLRNLRKCSEFFYHLFFAKKIMYGYLVNCCSPSCTRCVCMCVRARVCVCVSEWWLCSGVCGGGGPLPIPPKGHCGGWTPTRTQLAHGGLPPCRLTSRPTARYVWYVSAPAFLFGRPSFRTQKDPKYPGRASHSISQPGARLNPVSGALDWLPPLPARAPNCYSPLCLFFPPSYDVSVS